MAGPHWEERLMERAEAAVEPVKALAARHGLQAGFRHSIYLVVGGGPRFVQWSVAVNGLTRLGCNVEGVPPKEAAKMLRQMADALDDPELGPVCAAAIAQIPKPDGSARKYPPNFWE